jgi:hypothetical protein
LSAACALSLFILSSSAATNLRQMILNLDECYRYIVNISLRSGWHLCQRPASEGFVTIGNRLFLYLRKLLFVKWVEVIEWPARNGVATIETWTLSLAFMPISCCTWAYPDLRAHRIGAAVARELAASPHLASLTSLNLGNNRIGAAAAAQIYGRLRSRRGPPTGAGPSI